MVERRKHKRSKSPQLLPVLNKSSGEQLGMLVDLSIGGLLMITMGDVQVNQIYQLQIILPQPAGKSKTIEFSAEVAWADLQQPKETSWAGFQVIDITDYELERIGELIDTWSLAEIRSQT